MTDQTKNEIALYQRTGQVAVKKLLLSPEIKERFVQLTGSEKAPVYAESVLAAVANNDILASMPAGTIIQAALQATALRVPVYPALGLAYLVPYRGKNPTVTFMLSYKGWKHVLMRSGRYYDVDCIAIWDGMEVESDPVSGEFKVTGMKEAGAKRPKGWLAWIIWNPRLLDDGTVIPGKKKHLYMSIDEINAHRDRYSTEWRLKRGTEKEKDTFWVKHQDDMERKTPLKMLIKRQGEFDFEDKIALNSTGQTSKKDLAFEVTSDDFEQFDASVLELPETVTEVELPEEKRERERREEEAERFEGMHPDIERHWRMRTNSMLMGFKPSTRDEADLQELIRKYPDSRHYPKGHKLDRYVEPEPEPVAPPEEPDDMIVDADYQEVDEPEIQDELEDELKKEAFRIRDEVREMMTLHNKKRTKVTKEEELKFLNAINKSPLSTTGVATFLFGRKSFLDLAPTWKPGLMKYFELTEEGELTEEALQKAKTVEYYLYPGG